MLVVLSVGAPATEECLAMYRKAFAAASRPVVLVACAGLVAAASRALSSFDVDFFIGPLDLFFSVYDMVHS